MLFIKIFPANDPAFRPKLGCKSFTVKQIKISSLSMCFVNYDGDEKSKALKTFFSPLASVTNSIFIYTST